MILSIPSGQNQQKITVEVFIFSAVSGYVAWNHTKNKHLHSDFLLIIHTGKFDHGVSAGVFLT